MSQQLSRIVVSALFCTLATASFADSGGVAPGQKTAVQRQMAAYSTSEFGQNIASKSGKAASKTSSGSGCTSFGDYLQTQRN